MSVIDLRRTKSSKITSDLPRVVLYLPLLVLFLHILNCYKIPAVKQLLAGQVALVSAFQDFLSQSHDPTTAEPILQKLFTQGGACSSLWKTDNGGVSVSG